MSKKLHYFNLNGLAESIRYILHYSGQKFEDIRYNLKDWPIKEVKDSLPYGQLPLYQEGIISLNQSFAIARYVGAQAGLVPGDLVQSAFLDAIVLNVYDFWSKIVPYIKETDPTKKEQIKNEILNEHVEFYLSRFDREVRASGYCGQKLSWADFVLVGIIEAANLFLGTEIERRYQNLTALVNKIRTLPGVKEYIATRKPYVL